MLFKGKLLLYIHDDDSIYRLLLTGLALASPALHYLCFDHIYDPLWLRFTNSGICLAALSCSFSKPLRWAYIWLRYIAMVFFLASNNGLLLAANNFADSYLFSSVTVFIALTLFCRRPWGFVRLSTLNVTVITAAYFFDTNRAVSLTALIALLCTFTFIAYVSFLVRLIYKRRLEHSIRHVTQLNQVLTRNENELRKSRNQLRALINSLNDIIFEYSEDKRCINIWYNEAQEHVTNLKAFEGRLVAEVLGEEKARQFNDAIDFVISHLEATQIEFPSLFGTDRWFTAKVSPIFDQNGEYLHRVSVAISNITKQKRYETALKENQKLLLEAHLVARIGDWQFDLDTRQVSCSTSLCSIVETDHIPPYRNHFTYYLSLVHPEDRKAALVYFSTIANRPQSEFEHRLITLNGTLKYIRVKTGRHLTDHKGKIFKITGIIQDITEPKLAERAIKKSQADLMEAQSIARIGNWKWNVMHNRFNCSDELFYIYELTDKPSSGANVPFKRFFRYTHPEDKALLSQLLKSPYQFDKTSYEYRIITADKKVKYLSLIIGKVMRHEDGSLKRLIGTLQDITDRKLAEISQRRTENKYQLVLESINMAALSLDSAGTITFCNNYLANLLGYPQNELVGLNWAEKCLEKGRKSELDNWLQNDLIPPEYTNLAVCRDGERKIIRWRSTIEHDEHGSLREVTSIGEDITAEQMDRQKLITEKERAEQSSRYKSEFLSIMSHEIRTPMNAVIGTTNLLLSENPRPEQMQYLNALKFSGDNLLAIINDILDYNRIEVGRMELSYVTFNVKELVKNIQHVFYSKAAEKQLEIHLKCDDDIAQSLLGDPVRLNQIIGNLISNALKFTHTGQISVNLKKIEEDELNQTIRFRVADTGIGIAKDNLQKIFEPFMQETQFTHNHYGGSGLGLAITKRLIELHNSRIEVESEPGLGTAFTFDIQFKIAVTEEIKPQPEATVPVNMAGMRVLVVDDNQMNLLVASRFLKKWNIQSDMAENGRIAVEMADSNNYDLILMDLQMPVMDGFEATRIIKKINPDIPIIALTADAMPETYESALGAGMNDLLTKPFKPEGLFEKLSKFYNKTNTQPLAINYTDRIASTGSNLDAE